jgi:molybdenum cofactor biosynthesis MoaF-like protein
MESTANKGGEFISYPMNRVAGTIDDPTEAHAAIEALREAGYKLEEIDVLCGEEGMRRLDPTGKEHGLFARFQRTVLQYNSEYKYISHHEEDLRAGHFVIMVLAEEPERRETVVEILWSHGGHFIVFFGRWSMRLLDAGNTSAAHTDDENRLPTVGDIYEAEFGDAVFHFRFESEAEMTVTDPAKGTSATVQMSATVIRPGVLMLSWQEANKTTVVSVGDFENGIIYTNATRSDGTFLRMQGTLKRRQ